MHARILFPAVIAVLALVFGVIAQSYPAMSLQQGFGPRLFPTIVATAIVVLALIEIAIQTLGTKSGDTGKPGSTTVQGPPVTWRDFAASAFLSAVAIVAVLATPYAGFVAAMAVLLTVLSLAMGMRSLWSAALAAIAVAFSIHFVFIKGFGIALTF